MNYNRSIVMMYVNTICYTHELGYKYCYDVC